MKPEQIDSLEASINNIVRLWCTDGEVILARIRFVSKTQGDVIVDVLESTHLSRYPTYNHVVLVRFVDIESFAIQSI